MSLIRISESDDWIVDYDRERGMYRVSYFEDNHFKDEHWFDCFEDEELTVQEQAVDFSHLHKWFIDSVGTEEPVWTDEHIEELLDGFIVVPK